MKTMKFKIRSYRKYSNLFLNEMFDKLSGWHVSEEQASEYLQRMSLRELLELLNGKDVPEMCARKTIRHLSITRQLLESFKNFLDNTYYNNPKIPAAPLEQTFEEAILLTMKDFYGITSLEECSKRSVAEFMIARKSIYNSAVVQSKMYESLESRSKHS